jgi:hypothetical protein
VASVILEYLLWAEKLGDRHRCPRAVEVLWMIGYLGGLGQRSLSPSFSVTFPKPAPQFRLQSEI